jgi:hypothetical protein
MAVDVRGHLGIPEARLVSEVDAGFQHFTHADSHGISSEKVGSRIQPELQPDVPVATPFDGRVREFVDPGAPAVSGSRPGASR